MELSISALGGNRADILRGHHRVLFVERLQEALDQASAARGGHIQRCIVDKPGCAEESDRHWQRLQRLLQKAQLIQEVGLLRVRPDGRQTYYW
jgi:hypothetical protein